MKRNALLWLLLGIGVWAQNVPDEAQAFWRDEVRAGERRVLGWSPAWLSGKLMLCPAGSWAPEDIACLGTVLMYESVGSPDPAERRQHWNPAFSEEDFLRFGELLLGAPPAGDQAAALKGMHARYLKGASFGGRATVVKGSRVASLTLTVYAKVLGRKRDFAKALENLRDRMGWILELEEMPALVASDAIRQGLLRNIPFLYQTPKGAWYLGIACGEREPGVRFAVLGEVARFRPLGMTHWEAKGGDTAHAALPPGSGPWQGNAGTPQRSVPYDAVISPDRDLPPDFCLASVPLPDGKVFWIHGMRPDEHGWLLRIAAELGIPAEPADDLPEGKDERSRALWRDHVRGRERASVGGDWGIVQGLPLVPAPNRPQVRAAALAGTILATLPRHQDLSRFAFGQNEFVTAARDARWRSLSPAKQATVRRYYGDDGGQKSNARQRRLGLMEERFPYRCGHAFWGLSDEEVGRLCQLWARLAARVEAPREPGFAAEGGLAFLLRLLADAPDWEGGLRAVEGWHGWQATVETADEPSFAAFRDAVGMGVPVLLEDRDGGCRIAAGFLLADGKEYLLTVDPLQASPWLAAAGTDSAAHLERLLLPAAAPGRKAYLATAAGAHHPVTALLDSRLPLPDGARFEEFAPGRYRATFVHSWRKSVHPYAAELAGLLAPEPPETQTPVSFRLRFPESFPALVADQRHARWLSVDVREGKYAIWPVDHMNLGPPIAELLGYHAADRALFSSEGMVEMELLPGTYWIWIGNLPVATISVEPQDEGKIVDLRWEKLPLPRDVVVRLPEDLVLRDDRPCFTPYLAVAERRFFSFVARGQLPSAVRGRPLGKEHQDLPMRLFPGVFYVYDTAHYGDCKTPPIGKVVVPEQRTAEPLPVVPVTPEEARLATGDPMLPRPLDLDRKAMGAPAFLW